MPRRSRKKPSLDTLLARAVDGLLYPSETDAPLVPFRWRRTEASAEAAILAREGPTCPVERVSLDAFFEPLQRVQDAARYADLKALLQRGLTDPTVWRLGSPRVTIYVIGHDATDWVGVRTEAVET